MTYNDCLKFINEKKKMQLSNYKKKYPCLKSAFFLIMS